jgi:hypothetical protein
MDPATQEAVAQAAASGPASSISNTPDGLLVGTDPRPATQTPVITNSASDAQPATPAVTYTEADIAAARTEEKDKLYSRLDTMRTELDEIKKDRDAKQQKNTDQFKLAADVEAAEAAALKAKQESEMEVRDLLQQRDDEWQSKFQSIQEEQQRDRALLERERQYAELTAYQSQRVEQERDSIMPELLDLVTGSTREEIDASIESLKQRSEMIFASAQEAITSAQHDSSGARVTLPPAMENPSENQQHTPEAIRNMSLEEYAKQRKSLLSSRAKGETEGLFG